MAAYRAAVPIGGDLVEYMLLFYVPEVDEAERADRWAEMPVWDEVNASLREAWASS